MSAQRLYKAEWVHDDGIKLEEWEHELFEAGFQTQPEPAGWREYALDKWGTEPDGEFWPNGHKPFFWPNTDRVFRSRSAAQLRVDIINRWGGRAVLVECTPHWETVSAANARRKRAQLEAQKVRLYEKVYDIDEAIQATRIAEASA